MLFNGIKLVEGSESSSLIVNTGSDPVRPAPYIPTKGELFYKTTGVNPGLYVCDSVTVDSSGNVTAQDWTLQVNTGTAISSYLPSSGIAAGTYKSLTIDTYGRAIAGSNPTTLAGFGITDAMLYREDLNQIANLTGAGILKRAAGTASGLNSVWSLDNSFYLTQNQQINLTGDASGFGTTTINVALAPVLNVAPGTYGTASTVPVSTIDTKGRITHVANTPIAIDASALVSGFIPDARISPTSISQFQNQVAINENQIVDGTILARVAGNESITGTWSFVNPPSASAPTAPLHLANKAYVDAAASGVSSQRAVDVATTSSINLNGLQTIDGVQLTAGNRILVKDQISSVANGIYIASTVNWTRATDFDNLDIVAAPSSEVKTGALVYVSAGSANGNSSWVLTTPGTITLGTTPLAFTIFSRPGDFTAGAGLTLTNGHQFDIVSASTSRIVVNADSIDLATTAISPGTYSSVTVDAYGRATSGSTSQPWSSLSGVPTTIAGYGLTGAVQPFDNVLTGLTGITGSGITVKTGANSFATRSIAVTGTGISLANGDGLSGNPTISLNATDVNTPLTVVARNASGNFVAGTITANLAGNADTATKLSTARTISITNDISGTSTGFDGTGNVSISATLPSVNASVGSYGSAGVVPVITVNAKGLVTSVSTAAISSTSTAATITDDILSSSVVYPTWVVSTGTAAFNVSSSKLTYVPSTGILTATKFSGSGASLTSIPNASLVNSALTIGSTNVALGATAASLAGLTSVTATSFTGALVGNADTATKLSTARTISASGDATGTSATFDGSGNVSIPLTLATVATAGTYNTVTVNSKGLVTSGSNTTYLMGNQSITLSGDASGSGATAIALTLTSVGSAGTYTKVTTDSKGRVVSGTSLLGTDVTSALGFTPTSTASAGVANGYATLNSSGQLTAAQIPSSLLGAVVYQGVWNAATNIPPIASGVGTKGYYYKVSTAGATSIDGNNNWTIGDTIIYNGSTWDLIQGGTSDVSSVFGRIGAVTLLSNDVTTALGYTPYNSTNPSGYTTNTGTVTSVSGAGTVSGLSLTGTVISSGSITLGGTLAVTPANFALQVANTFLAAPSGAAGAPTFRALVAADVPTLNQNTTGTAASVTAAAQPNITSVGTLTGLTISNNANGVTQNGNVAAAMGFSVVNTNATGYAQIALSANSQVKTLRCAYGGALEVVNTANTAVILSVDNTGNLTAAGNVGAYSDERLKTNWTDLSPDFVSLLADVKTGTYDRIDTGDKQVGVSAQSLQAILPEAINTNDDGILSVAYGNAALAACVMLAKQVEILKARIEQLEAK